MSVCLSPVCQDDNLASVFGLAYPVQWTFKGNFRTAQARRSGDGSLAAGCRGGAPVKGPGG